MPVDLNSLKVGRLAPSAGDTVKFTVEGSVDHIDEQEGYAYVKPEKANGKDIPQDDSGNNSEPTEDDLQSKAEQMDQQGNYS